MLRFLVITLFISGIYSLLPAQIAGDMSFESGRLDSFYLADNHYTLAPIAQLFGRITGVKDSTPRFRIFDHEGFRLRFDHRMVYRLGSDSIWHFFDNGEKTGGKAYYRFWNDQPFAEDTVFVAYWFPYTYSQLQTYLSSIQSSPYVHNLAPRGQSIQNRDLYGLTLTDPAVPDSCKLQVVITGKQHPIEFTQSYIIEGLIDYLITGSDTLARRLRREFRFHIYPMLNPDGVFNGVGQNAQGSGLNRDWAPGITPNGTVEIDVARAAIWNDCGGKADFSIDLHGNPGHRGAFYWWGQTSGPDTAHTGRALRYVQSVHRWDGQLHPAPNLIQNYIQGDTYGGTAFTAGNWHFGTLGAVSFTFEPASTPPVSIERLKQVGEALARGFAGFRPTRVCDTVSTHLESLPGDVDVEVTPNPSPGVFTVSGQKTRGTNVIIRLFSIEGRKLGELSSKASSSPNFAVTVDCNAFPALVSYQGTVLLEIQIENHITHKKLVISN